MTAYTGHVNVYMHAYITVNDANVRFRSDIQEKRLMQMIAGTKCGCSMRKGP